MPTLTDKTQTRVPDLALSLKKKNIIRRKIFASLEFDYFRVQLKFAFKILCSEQHSPLPHVPCPLALTVAEIRYTRYSLWRRNLSHNSLSCQIPSVSSEKLALPRLCAVNCPDFAATVTAFSCPLTYAG